MAMRYYSSVAPVMALTAAINDTATIVAVDKVAGLPAQVPFTLVLDVGQTGEEVVTVTAVSGLNLTVARGQDGTAATSHATGAAARHMVTGRDLAEPQQHMAATTGVHGITSSVVGTSDTQALTNKTIDGSNNTLSNVPQAAVTGLPAALSGLSSADATHAALTAAHGATGEVVGTTNVQTLTNKTLASPTVNAGTMNTPTINSPTVVTPPANVARPTGEVTMWAALAATAAPTGWLLCDGSAVSRETYADLFAVIGSSFGSGNGVSTFNLPNLKGRVPVGQDSTQAEFDAIGEAGGAKTHTLTATEMPSHFHTSPAHGHGYVTAQFKNVEVQAGTGAFNMWGGADVATTTGLNSVTTDATGGGGAHNNLQPYLVMRYIIKT